MRRTYKGDPPALFMLMEVGASGVAKRPKVPGKIDIGAAMTVIPEPLCRKLGLVRFGARTVRSIGAHQPYLPTFLVDLVVEGVSFRKEVLTHRRPYVLIGRDILNDFVLTANGPAGWFELVAGGS